MSTASPISDADDFSHFRRQSSLFTISGVAHLSPSLITSVSLSSAAAPQSLFRKGIFDPWIFYFDCPLSYIDFEFRRIIGIWHHYFSIWWSIYAMIHLDEFFWVWFKGVNVGVGTYENSVAGISHWKWSYKSCNPIPSLSWLCAGNGFDFASRAWSFRKDCPTVWTIH